MSVEEHSFFASVKRYCNQSLQRSRINLSESDECRSFQDVSLWFVADMYLEIVFLITMSLRELGIVHRIYTGI